MRRVTRNRTNWRNVATIISVTVLVGTEVMAAALAGGWALAGLLELSLAFQYGLMTLFGALGLWCMVKFVRSALSVEPIKGE